MQPLIFILLEWLMAHCFFIAIVCVRDWYEGKMYREKWRKNFKKELVSLLAHGPAGMPLVIFVKIKVL
jgi:hypothetical protein